MNDTDTMTASLNLAIDYELLAGLLAKKLKEDDKLSNLIADDRQETDIWGTKNCSEYLGCSLSHFRDRVSKQPHFPAPIRGFKHKWVAGEIKSWAIRKRK